MYRLEFQIDGDKVLSRNIRVAGDKIRDMRVEMAQIGQVVRESAIDNIDNQGSEGGGAWKPLSARTVKARSERRGNYRQASNGA